MPLDRVRGQPLFDALVDRADGRWGRLRYRPSLVLILLTSLVALVPLAHASPPDPLWIAGAYDGDDLDELVVAVTSLVGAQVAVPLVERAPISVEVVGPRVPARDAEAPPSQELSVPPSPPRSARLTRAPPAV